MTAEPPQSPVTEAVRSLEVRWIFPGQLETAVARWFGRFPAGTESREDTYLLDPRWRGLSMKVRGGGALEVKAYRGSPGILEVAGRARGRLRPGRSGPFPSARPARTAPARPAGDRYAKGDASAGSGWPADGGDATVRPAGCRPANGRSRASSSRPATAPARSASGIWARPTTRCPPGTASTRCTTR